MKSRITGRVEEWWKSVCQKHNCKYYIHNDYPSCSYCTCPDNCIVVKKRQKVRVRMKLIIDIPDGFYESISQYGVIDTYDKSLIEFAIKNGTPLKEWLSSFNTDSASICFNKIQELKRECEKE